MKRIICLSFLSLQFFLLYAQYSVQGNVFTYSVSANTGIQAVYIANGLGSITISYTADQGKSIKWFYYKNSLADKVEVNSSSVNVSHDGSSSTYSISAPLDESGYFVEEDGVMKSTMWMIDYSLHLPQFNSLSVMANSDCSDRTVSLDVNKSDKVYYFANSGAAYALTMQYKLQYNKQTWDSGSKAFVSSAVSGSWQTVGTYLTVDAPLLDTQFTLSGDKIADYLGLSKSISVSYAEKFTEAHIVASQAPHNATNEVDSIGENGLGGSAPCEITFAGYSNEPTTGYYDWTIFKTKDLKNWIARYNDKSFTYTFTDAGNYTVYLATTDVASSCTDTASITFTVSESFLDLPNYFTPNASPGVNDEYKVAYKSLVSFKATIFNRWGNKLFEWIDPSKGWDGKYHGKFVSPGVYYVVVEAKGSDGISYKKARDINILTTP